MTAKDLKNSIIQEAVQGKLVPQIASEGNARDLLEDIRKEKARLEKEGKIKKDKALSEIAEEELPFEIPENWCWCRLGDVVSILGDGIHGTPNYDISGNYYFVNGNNLNNGKIEIKPDTKKVNQSEYEKYKKDLNKNTVFVSINGTLGNVAFYEDEKIILGKSACYFNLIKNEMKQFIYWLIKTKYFLDYANQEATGTTIKNVSLAAMRNLPIPLPPLAEQKCIVAAIEKFMPLIEEYGKKETELKVFNEQIGTLTRKAILQEAVQGKLVPQIAAEGNAKKLLEEIKKEKSKLIKEGKIKKEKTLPEITEDEIPFDIPDSWCWCRLGEICEIARGGSPRPIKDYLTTNEDGYNWIKIGDTDINGKYINHTEEKIIKEGLHKTRLVHKGDFLLTNSMSFGRPYILNIDGCIHDGWLVISPRGNIFDKDFLYYVLSSSYAYNQFCESVSGAVVKNLNSDKVRESLFPLPPLAEQKRIVAAIEKLLPLCNALDRNCK